MATLKLCTIASVAALMIFPLGAQPQDKPTKESNEAQATTQQLSQSMCDSLGFNSTVCKGGRYTVGGGSIYLGKKLRMQNRDARLINAKDPELVKKATALKTDYKAAFVASGRAEETAGVMAEDLTHLVGRPIVKHLGTGAIVLGIYEFWQSNKTTTSSRDENGLKVTTPEKK